MLLSSSEEEFVSEADLNASHPSAYQPFSLANEIGESFAVT